MPAQTSQNTQLGRLRKGGIGRGFFPAVGWLGRGDVDGRRAQDGENERFDWLVVPFHLAPMGGRTTPRSVATSFHWPVVDGKRKGLAGGKWRNAVQGASWLSCMVYGDCRSIGLLIWQRMGFVCFVDALLRWL